MPLFYVTLRVVTVHEVRVYADTEADAQAIAERVVDDADDLRPGDTAAVESRDEERVLCEIDDVKRIED